MPYSTNAKDAMLAELASLITHVSLHDGDPGAGGANELAGGGYARIAVTWGAPAGGSIDMVETPDFTVPAGADVTHVGYWGALAVGTFYGSSDIPDESYTGAGTYELLDADLDLNA